MTMTEVPNVRNGFVFVFVSVWLIPVVGRRVSDACGGCLFGLRGMASGGPFQLRRPAQGHPLAANCGKHSRWPSVRSGGAAREMGDGACGLRTLRRSMCITALPDAPDADRTGQGAGSHRAVVGGDRQRYAGCEAVTGTSRFACMAAGERGFRGAVSCGTESGRPHLSGRSAWQSDAAFPGSG